MDTIVNFFNNYCDYNMINNSAMSAYLVKCINELPEEKRNEIYANISLNLFINITKTISFDETILQFLLYNSNYSDVREYIPLLLQQPFDWKVKKYDDAILLYYVNNVNMTKISLDYLICIFKCSIIHNTQYDKISRKLFKIIYNTFKKNKNTKEIHIIIIDLINYVITNKIKYEKQILGIFYKIIIGDETDDKLNNKFYKICVILIENKILKNTYVIGNILQNYYVNKSECNIYYIKLCHYVLDNMLISGMFVNISNEFTIDKYEYTDEMFSSTIFNYYNKIDTKFSIYDMKYVNAIKLNKFKYLKLVRSKKICINIKSIIN